jgi:peptidylprolyl isomerase domain and WD repeat-containing protein 1
MVYIRCSDESYQGDRDVFNEKPTREEQSVAVAQSAKQFSTRAILRTTLGDIHLQLFPEYAPRAVENFVTHSKNGYYDNVLIHRVIKGFMIQMGDPLGRFDVMRNRQTLTHCTHTHTHTYRRWHRR